MSVMISADLLVNVPLAVLDDDDDDDNAYGDESRFDGNLSPSVGDCAEPGSKFSHRSTHSCDTNFSAYTNSSRSYSDEIYFKTNNGRIFSDCRSEYISNEDIGPDMDTFSDTLAVSLENLVTNFDEKISNCLKNLNEKTDMLAPVQMNGVQCHHGAVRTWSEFEQKSSSDFCTCAKLPSVRSRQTAGSIDSCVTDLSYDSDLEFARATNFNVNHSNSGVFKCDPLFPGPPQTAEEVIDEIDQLMQQSCNSESTAISDCTMESSSSVYSSLKSPSLHSYLNTNGEVATENGAALLTNISELKSVPITKLKSYEFGFEALIKIYNEALVHELALRDELAYEKELKNTFISLMSAIQSKKRKYHLENKRRKANGRPPRLLLLGGFGQNILTVPQYLTTIVPYDIIGSPMSVQTLEALIKVLRAINDDNPSVPMMLTDYILNAPVMHVLNDNSFGKKDSLHNSIAKNGLYGGLLGLLAGPIVSTLWMRNMNSIQKFDRCYRLRFNKRQINADRCAIIGALCGAIIDGGHGLVLGVDISILANFLFTGHSPISFHIDD